MPIQVFTVETILVSWV